VRARIVLPEDRLTALEGLHPQPLGEHVQLVGPELGEQRDPSKVRDDIRVGHARAR